jgi:hypothetical protein
MIRPTSHQFRSESKSFLNTEQQTAVLMIRQIFREAWTVIFRCLCSCSRLLRHTLKPPPTCVFVAALSEVGIAFKTGPTAMAGDRGRLRNCAAKLK